MKLYYKTLELQNFAVETEVKKQFKTLSLKYHPDRNGGNKVIEEKYKGIVEAYTILSVRETKLIYDTQLRNYLQPKLTVQKPKQPTVQPQPQTAKVDVDEVLFDILFERKRKTSDGAKVAAGLFFLYKTFKKK